MRYSELDPVSTTALYVDLYIGLSQHARIAHRASGGFHVRSKALARGSLVSVGRYRGSRRIRCTHYLHDAAGVLTLTSGPTTFQAVTAGGVSPPTIAKSFGAATIIVNNSTSLSFTLTNPNASSLTGVGFTDSLPAGLVVSTPNGLSGSCGGGAITAVAGSGSVNLSGAALAAGASCNFSVNATGTATGTKVNVTGAVTSTEGGSGGTATASVTVNPVAPPPPPPASSTPIPTLQESLLWLLALLLAISAAAFLRKRGH